MIWLLLSIFCSTLIFVVFKLFDRYGISNLQAIVINYFIAFTVGWLSDGFDFHLAELFSKDWIWSTLLLGFMFITLFQLMAFVSQKFGVSAVSVAVKMSLVIPVVIAVMYYGDSMPALKVAGIIAALGAVYFATLKPEKTKGHISYAFLPILLFLGSGLLDALLNYNQKMLVPPEEHAYFASMIFLTAGLIGIGLLIFKLAKGLEKLQLKNISGGIALGIPNYGSIYFLLKALEIESLESSIIFPINNVGVVALSVIGGRILFDEKLSKINKVGIGMALLAIVLIAFEKLY